MKRLLVIILSLGIVYTASAQHYSHGGSFYARPRVVIGIGAYSPWYPGFYSPFYPYPGYYYNNGYHRPSKLDMKLEDIRNDYKDRIWSAKHDTSIPRKERRQKVRELKHERDQTINDVKVNYYKTPK